MAPCRCGVGTPGKPECLPSWLELPGGLPSGRRIVRVTVERLSHIAARRPDWILFCLTHMARVIADPEFIGYRPDLDRRRVELIRRVDGRYLLVALKYLEEPDEAWVSTALPVSQPFLTRRLRAGTMQSVRRGP